MNYWQHSSQFWALFISSGIIFSLTNDLMLIFIYNFHLFDIMASSGLLSKADKLTSSIIALESTMQKCLLPKTGAFYYHRVVIVMNECIFMYAHMYANIFSHLILWKLWSSLCRTSYLCRVFPSNRCWLACQFLLTITLCLIFVSMSNVSLCCQFLLGKHIIWLQFA